VQLDPVREPSRYPGRPQSRLRSVVGSAVLGVVATGFLSLIGGVPLTPLDSDGIGGGRHVASVAPGALPTSQAITSEAGPVHPVHVSGAVDYGDAGARFGAARYGHVHEGQDVIAESGTPLLAVRDAVVLETGSDGGRGNYVAIHSPTEDQTYVYMHMLHPSSLEPGDEVAAGSQVGAMGCTGSCYGTHLHFEVRLGRGADEKPIDPLPLLKRWPVAP
jgi:murein DD-endopeptidase MepM/ murein hydrolase activator NlpD